MMADNSEQGSLLGKIAAYTELLHKDPSSTIFVPLSEAYRQMGMLDDAIDIAQKGIMQTPAFPSGYVAYGRGLAQQGLLEEAVAEFDKALILDPKNLSALKSLAKIRIQQGIWDEAFKLLDQARKINPADASVLKMLSILEQKKEKKNFPNASDVNETSISQVDLPGKSVEPISTATIAEIYIRQGFPEKALKVYRDLLRSEPQNAQLRQKLIALKEHISDVHTEVTAADSGVLQPVSSSVESSTVQISESAVTQTESSYMDNGSSLTEIFANWLDSISRRREAHVQ